MDEYDRCTDVFVALVASGSEMSMTSIPNKGETPGVARNHKIKHMLNQTPTLHTWVQKPSPFGSSRFILNSFRDPEGRSRSPEKRRCFSGVGRVWNVIDMFGVIGSAVQGLES